MRYLLISLFILSSSWLMAQDYNEAAGGRIGLLSGLTYRNFQDDSRAVEMSLSFARGGAEFSILRQYHQPILLDITNQFFFYYGFGGGVGFATLSEEKYIFNTEYYRKTQLSAGISFILNLGLEFHSIKYPFAFSLDYKPYVAIDLPLGFRRNYYNFGVTLLYTF